MPETTGPLPGTLVPQAHGGKLRRGGGRPPLSNAQKEALDRLRKAAPELIEKLVQLAKKGDRRALELALAYAIGKPVEKVEMSGPDGGPIEHRAYTLDDHETALLKDAIERHLSTRRVAGSPADGAAAGHEAGDAVAHPRPTEPTPA